MASSRSSPPAEGRYGGQKVGAAAQTGRAPTTTAIDASLPADPLIASLHDAISRFVVGATPRHGILRAAVALSGGRDSMALLDVLARCASHLGIALSAAHVHHGLSPNADAWAHLCADECAKRAIPLTVKRVSVQRAPGKSLEATARTERYKAFSTIDVDAIVLAHHADDQAETLLLQLLRGAGPRGLAAMPAARPGEGPALLRPWLSVPRAAIEAYAQSRGLSFVDDESNADRGLKRNYLRHEIGPLLSAAFPGYPQTLVRAAAHNAEASELLDQLAALDAREVCASNRAGALTIGRAALIELARTSMPRARNLLRWFLRQHALPFPSTRRLAGMLDQLLQAAPDARVRLVHGGAELGIFRGRVVVHGPRVAGFSAVWTGERSIALPHGVLEFTPTRGDGIAADALGANRVTVRQRMGRERLRLFPDGRTRPVKRLLYDAGIAPWQRASLPFVYCGDTLAAVAGLGVDAAFRAGPGKTGIALIWYPRHP